MPLYVCGSRCVHVCLLVLCEYYLNYNTNPFVLPKERFIGIMRADGGSIMTLDQQEKTRLLL